MTEPTSHAGYVFDRQRGDHERLIQSSELLAPFIIEGCVRTGLARGGRAIDIGCGPIGALPVLAELVGPEGRVLGLDASGEALGTARAILDERGFKMVTLVEAELANVPTSDLCPPGPFDLAYVRRFLVHQADPAASLRRIAELLRPGGRIVAHEIPPGTGYPSLTPRVPALQRVDELVHAAVHARGGKYDAAHHFEALCRDAGVRVLGQRGFLPAAQPVLLLETFQAVLGSLRPVIVHHHLATTGEIDDLLHQLEEAKQGKYVSCFANLYIEVIAEA